MAITPSSITNFLNSNACSISKDKCLKTLSLLYLSRFIDDKMDIIARQNKGTAFFLSTKGHELVGIVAAMSLTKGKDWSLPYYRDRAFALALGEDPVDIMAAFMARNSVNHSSGRMMLDHFVNIDTKIPCQSSCVGAQFLQAVGVGKSIKLRDEDEIVYVSAGDGATSQGDFHEALNFACIHNLPVIFVIQDNAFAISVKKEEQTAGGSIASISQGYDNLQIIDVDGTDYVAMSLAMHKATTKARSKNGPSIVVAHVPRINSHTNSDDQAVYKSFDEMERERQNDPLIKLEQFVLDKNYASREEMDDMKSSIKKNIDEEVAVKAEMIPFADTNNVEDHVFKEYFPPATKTQGAKGEVVVMVEAINSAITEEMQRDETVVVFGQDVAGDKGGVFGVTKGLTKKFGEKRCYNTPLAESTIIGTAIGMAQTGYFKPVVEIQFIDYVWTGMNQLVNEMASIHYRSNGKSMCPCVVRLPFGGYIQGGPYHSQSIEAVFTHIPGLKVVVPSNSYDAKRLMKTAILDPNPVMFLEHKALYRQHNFCARSLASKDDFLPFGKANIVNEGDDITVVAWGMMVMVANEIARELLSKGISVEVIDLRTLVPLDMDTILTSIKKTGKLLVAHEAVVNCGFGAEIAARVSNDGFMFLDAPIKRVGAKHCPVPFCKDLENSVLPQKEDVVKAIEELLSF
jgi:2-oxoisovalerate dehydrogenase E1 component